MLWPWGRWKVKLGAAERAGICVGMGDGGVVYFDIRDLA